MLIGLINYCCQTPEDAAEFIAEVVLDVLRQGAICPHCVIVHIAEDMRAELLGEAGEDETIKRLLAMIDDNGETRH